MDAESCRHCERTIYLDYDEEVWLASEYDPWAVQRNRTDSLPPDVCEGTYVHGMYGEHEPDVSVSEGEIAEAIASIQEAAAHRATMG